MKIRYALDSMKTIFYYFKTFPKLIRIFNIAPLILDTRHHDASFNLFGRTTSYEQTGFVSTIKIVICRCF